MRRLLLFVFAFSLCFLAYGTSYHPEYAAFWLASSDTTLQMIRLLLAGALIVQFVTHPPRNIYFRILCGFISVASATWVLQQSNAFSMMFLDTLSILGASAATAITALEFDYEAEEHTTGKHIYVS